jgi:hypothetical protein
LLRVRENTRFVDGGLEVAGCGEAVVLICGGDSFREGAICPALFLFSILSQSEKIHHLKMREYYY